MLFRSDTADKINATGGVQVADIVSEIARGVAEPHFQLAYLGPSAQSTLARSGERHGRAKSGAYLGTIPDYAKLTSPHGPGGGGAEGEAERSAEGGVPLSGVRALSPAEQAGLRPGDVLTAIVLTGELNMPEARVRKNIKTLDDFMSILVQLKPGQRIYIELNRDGVKRVLPATVGKREG